MVEVDWDNDGTFVGAYDDISTDVMYVEVSRGKDERLPYDRIKANTGRMALTVKNTGGKYNPENSGGVLYGNLLPRRPARFRIEYDGVVYEQFYGYIENIIPHPHKSEQTARILCVDGMDYLSRADVHVVLQEDQYSGTLVGLLLDSAGWSATKRSIDTGISLFSIWYGYGKGLDEIRKLEDSDLGFFYIDESGNAVWEDRHYRLVTTRCNTSQATFTDSMVDITYMEGARSIFNEVRCPVTPHTLESAAEIWEMVDVAGSNELVGVPFLEIGQSKTFWAEFTNFAKNIVDPMVAYNGANFNYRANAAADNSGADATGDVTCTITPFAKSAKVVVTNNGAISCYITSLNIRGQVYTDGRTVSAKAEDSTSQSIYQQRTMVLEGEYFDDMETAESMCEYTLSLRKDPQPEMTLTMMNSDATLEEEMLKRKISDRITVVHTDLGVNDDFYINKTHSRWNANATRMTTTWTVARADDEQYWTLGTSALGSTTRLAF